MWRLAKSRDSKAIIEMCTHLYREDPSPKPVSLDHIQKTLTELQAQPVRGKVLVLELENRVHGYALLIGFWSNELGGEICNVDEIYVRPRWRGQGHATQLIQSLIQNGPFTGPEVVALELEVTAQNAKAKVLYSRLGFQAAPNERMRLLR